MESSERPVIIIGAGGHAKVVLDALLASGRKVLGLTDSDPAKKGQKVLGVTVLGSDQEIENYKPDQVELANGVGSTRTMDLRTKIFEQFKARGYGFATIVHPSVVVASDVRLGMGVQLMARVVINPGSSIGENTLINTGSVIDHDNQIGSHCHIAPGTVCSGGVSVANSVHIGSGSVLIQGVQIEEGVLLGAGSVVTRNISKGVKAFGVPAKEVTQ